MGGRGEGGGLGREGGREGGAIALDESSLCG